MTLLDGQSEIDRVELRLPDYGRVIKNWSQYTYNSTFLTPTAGWSFRISEEDTTLVNDLLAPGARVELAINDQIQCSGTIDRKTVAGDEGGTSVTVQGRDILGRVVDSTMDPAYKFNSGITVIDLVLGVLRPYGITKVYSSDDLNIGVISGYQRGKGGGARTVSVQVPQRTENADGTVDLTYTSEAGVVVSDPNDSRPDLTKITLQQAKPHIAEGVYAFLDRSLRRLGYAFWAAADGSGVVVDKPKFTGSPQGTIIRRRSDGGVNNNAKRGEVRIDLASQPSCIVVLGHGGGKDAEHAKLKVIMINELVGLDDKGKPIPEVANIIARNKGALVLPIRKELASLPRPKGDRLLASPMFTKDIESKNQEHAVSFVRREMANRQQRALSASYTMIGHTQSDHPWATNTLVSVDDEVGDIHRDMWAIEKTFSKTTNGGTTSDLRLILPHTLQIGE